MDIILQKKCSQKQLRNTSRMNIFVLLMTLLLVNGHCSAAYASSVTPPQTTDQYSASDELIDLATATGHHSDSVPDCLDMHDNDPSSQLLSSSWQQLKDKQDNAQPLVAALNSMPPSRAGPCDTAAILPVTDFISPSLLYTLCVLRL